MGEKLIRAGRLYYHLYLSMCFLPFFFLQVLQSVSEDCSHMLMRCEQVKWYSGMVTSKQSLHGNILKHVPFWFCMSRQPVELNEYLRRARAAVRRSRGRTFLKAQCASEGDTHCRSGPFCATIPFLSSLSQFQCWSMSFAATKTDCTEWGNTPPWTRSFSLRKNLAPFPKAKSWDQGMGEEQRVRNHREGIWN